MAIRGFLSHVDLNVGDTDVSIPFYAALLEQLVFERTGLTDAWRASWRLIDDRGAHFEIEVRRPRGAPSARRRTRNDPGIDHLAFHADSHVDVDSIFEHLVDHGVAVDEPPRGYEYSPGYYAVGFDDPDGIRLEVVDDPTTNPSS